VGCNNITGETLGQNLVTSYKGEQINIPKPWEWSAGITLGELAYRWLANHDKRAAGQLADVAVDLAFPPMPILNNPLVKGSWELYTNQKNFSWWKPSRPIVPDSGDDTRASYLGRVIGDMIGFHPLKVDHAIGTFAGSFGRDVLSGSNEFDDSSPTRAWHDKVIVRRFLKDPNRYSDRTEKFWHHMSRTNGDYENTKARLAFDLKSLSDYKRQKAINEIRAMPDGQAAYMILNLATDSDDKKLFKVEDQRLHPMKRAYDAVSVLNALNTEIFKNSIRTYARGAGAGRIELTREQRGQLTQLINELQTLEMANSLKLNGEPGYENQRTYSTEDVMKQIQHVSPKVAEEIRTRYATKKIYKYSTLERLWPKAKKAILKADNTFDVRQFSREAASAGWEFGGIKGNAPPAVGIQLGR